LQRLAMNTIAESGEVLVRRYRRPLSAGLAIPVQLQVLEPDHLDMTRDNIRTESGGKIIQGIEFDADGRRVAYWILPEHPGASFQFNVTRLTGVSKRVPAEDVLHGYDVDRANQARGYSWFAAAIVKLKEFDEFEDAQLLRQKIAACLAAFVTDVDGAGVTLGDKSNDSTSSAGSPQIETIEPATIINLPVGKQVTMADPPQVAEGNFDQRTLRAIAAGLGITYEDLTGDYSQVNFSSARMSRLAHWGNVHNWQWNMVIPMLCDPVWEWSMEAALLAGTFGDTMLREQLPSADWTPQPMPMIDPDKEALAAMRMVRSGMRTFDDIVREQGFDPDTFWPAYAASQKRLDSLGIILDTDARQRTQAGNPTAPKAPPKRPTA
jgi:lambda family phage portal protein